MTEDEASASSVLLTLISYISRLEQIMGFGLLLIGYFLSFAIALSGSSYFIDIAGGFLMTYALLKLSEYSLKFKSSVPYSLAFTVVTFVTSVMSFFELGYTVWLVANTLRAALILMFHIYTFSALEDMARGADDEKLAYKAKRNLIVVIVYFVVFAIVTLLEPFFNVEFKAYSEAMLYIYRVVWLIMNLLLLHSAYARLYIEGTEEAFAQLPKLKESRFEFVNKIRRRYYESQKKALEENYKLMKEAKDYASANRDKYEAKKKKKKHKK